CRAFVAWMPDLECLGVAVDDPVFRDSVPLKGTPLRDAIVPGRSRGEHLDDQQGSNRGVRGRRSTSVDPGKDEEIRLVSFARHEIELAGSKTYFAEPLARHVRVQQDGELEDDALMAPARCRRHKELAIDELIPRRQAFSLLGETLDF